MRRLRRKEREVEIQTLGGGLWNNKAEKRFVKNEMGVGVRELFSKKQGESTTKKLIRLVTQVSHFRHHLRHSLTIAVTRRQLLPSRVHFAAHAAELLLIGSRSFRSWRCPWSFCVSHSLLTLAVLLLLCTTSLIQL